MAQYIKVFLDDEERHYRNPGLREIIEYIGKQESKDGASLSSTEAYKLGKKLINARLKKWHKTAIKRLVEADKYEFTYNGNQKDSKAVWKIHKNKARRVFKVIYSILRGYNNDTSNVRSLFITLCKKYGLPSGAEVVGSPYYAQIGNTPRLIAGNWDKEEMSSLSKCAAEIKTFSEFHGAN